ncbi:MAG TPA: Gfo/Idh/MocA family oxidoreductase [Verrucomicrobiae bacterium]|nr:Gfo/Idh/MocA family oxidoreductase [Verrucomicrobiae bacterium]
MATSGKLHYGILGTGLMFGKFAEAFRLIDDASLAAVASRDADRARAAGVKHGVPRAHAGYESLVRDPEIDVIINALHNGLHCEWTVRALEAGKHVLCEKPLACSSAEVEKMFAAAHAHDRLLMEGFMYRFHPQMAEAKRIIASGDIGRVLHIRCHRTSRGRDRDNPRYWREAGGGALMDIGCYCVNLARFVESAEPMRVAAHAHFDKKSGVDLTLSGCLQFDDGVTANVLCSIEGEPSYPAEIVGADAKLLIPHPWLPPAYPAELYLTREGKTDVVRIEPDDMPHHTLAPFALEVKYFSRCVRENRAPQFPPSIDAEADSRANMRVIEALLESAREQRLVDV